MPIERRNLPGLAQPPGYTHLAWVSEARLVLIAGQVPLNERGGLVGHGDAIAQVRQCLRNHADGGTLAQRVYIHQLPQTAPRLAELIEGVFGPGARNTPAISAGRPVEGTGAKPERRSRPDRTVGSRVSAAQG